MPPPRLWVTSASMSSRASSNPPLVLGTTLASEASDASASSNAWKSCVKGNVGWRWYSIENLVHNLWPGAVASGDGPNGDTVELVRCLYGESPSPARERDVGLPASANPARLAFRILQRGDHGGTRSPIRVNSALQARKGIDDPI